MKKLLTILCLVLLVIIFFNFSNIVRFLWLDEDQRRYRKLNLNSEIRMIEKCQRLNRIYTPYNSKRQKTHENIKYGDPFFYVTFDGDNGYSRCHVNIGWKHPGYQFSEDDEGYDIFFCDYLEGSGCP